MASIDAQPIDTSQYFGALRTIVADPAVARVFYDKIRIHGLSQEAKRKAAEVMQLFFHREWVKDGLRYFMYDEEESLPQEPAIATLREILDDDEMDDFIREQMEIFQAKVDEEFDF